MELESETLFASTWDNVEAILKRILIILSETFDKNTDFEAVSEKIPVIGQVIFVICSSDRFFLAISHSHRYTSMPHRSQRYNVQAES